MKNIIDRLKQKPEKVREQIAILAAGGVTLIVIVIWVFSLSNRFKSPGITTQDDGTTVAPEKPFGVLFDSLKNSFDNQSNSGITNPFANDESNSYQNTQTSDDQSVETTTNTEQGSGAMQPSVLSVDTTDTTTSNDTSKDQNNQ